MRAREARGVRRRVWQVVAGLALVSATACASPGTDYRNLSAALLNAPGTSVVGPGGHAASTAARQAQLAGRLGISVQRGAIRGRTGRLTPRVEKAAAYLQCVPFARDLSGVQIRGDAVTWWDQAAGRYSRAKRPQLGAVMVLKGYRNAQRGHVAVVTRMIDSRTIVIDHANWLNDGRIYIDTPVIDVSRNNDWSVVRVWSVATKAYGPRVYGVRGFILPTPDIRTAEAAPVTVTAMMAR